MRPEPERHPSSEHGSRAVWGRKCLEAVSRLSSAVHRVPVLGERTTGQPCSPLHASTGPKPRTKQETSRPSDPTPELRVAVSLARLGHCHGQVTLSALRGLVAGCWYYQSEAQQQSAVAIDRPRRYRATGMPTHPESECEFGGSLTCHVVGDEESLTFEIEVTRKASHNNPRLVPPKPGSRGRAQP